MLNSNCGEDTRKRMEALKLVTGDATPEGFYVPPGADPALKLYHGAFNLEWIRQLSVDPTVIFDIGAYDGGDAIRFKIAFPLARVFAFEADIDRFSLLMNYAGHFGVETKQVALLDRDSPVNWFSAEDDLHGNGHRGSQGSIYRQTEALDRAFPHVHQSKTPTAVQGLRLDTFCMENGIETVDVLHMDVQGAEYDVVVGFGQLRPKLIYAEVMPEHLGGWVGAKSPKALHCLLSSMGYVLAGDFSTDRLYVHYTAIRLADLSSNDEQDS
jgi:FkbM family methyltransferase